MYPFESRYFGHSHEVCEGSHGGRSACEAIFGLIADAAEALSYSSDPTAPEAQERARMSIALPVKLHSVGMAVSL